MNVDKIKSEYEKVVLTYNRKLLWYAKMLCNNKDHAEEITQETLLTGYKYFNGLRDRQKVFSWLKTIAKRIYLRKYRPETDYDFTVSLDSPVFDGGAYKFVYADRHTLYNECVTVSCSYIK